MQARLSDDDTEIREMREEDLDEVMAIEQRSFVTPWSKRLFQETINFSLSYNFVARKKIDKKVIGYANFYLVRNEAQVLNIAIAPEARKMGYASRLLSYAMCVLAEQDAEEFFLEVRESNTDAINLYKRMGFSAVGRRKNYYSETNEDAIIMHCKTRHRHDC